ncbi:MAG: OB-fold nucleic acid binding domain-containing protein [Candidatus Micrarchaeota archaeon]|nr:OB-fold nucleic acid binding domain-containing protein [Candidatus Micrarchaeota archaeon]
MKISELKAGTGNASIEAEVVSMEEARDVMGKFGKRLRVASATLKDDSGEIVLSLWNDDADKYAQGDKIKITDGWVSEYKGQLRISAGRSGKIEKI